MSPSYQRVGVVLSSVTVLNACHLLENFRWILLRSWFIVNFLRLFSPFPGNSLPFHTIFRDFLGLVVGEQLDILPGAVGRGAVDGRGSGSIGAL